MRTQLTTGKGVVHIGTRIRIGHLNNGDSPINDSDYDSREGTVEEIDDIGGMHGTWGGLAVYDTDDFEIVNS